MIRLKWKCATIALILLFIKAQLFHALGIAPVDYKKGQEIDVEAIKMISTHAQIFHEYYSLPFCLPKNGTISYKSENLGEILRGDKIVKTPYKIAMAQNISCKLLCHKPTEPMTWNESYSSVVIERIQQAYIVYLSIDDFLAPTIAEFSRKTYAGYYIGGIDEKNMVYINNYLKLKLTYHKHGENEFRVVGFVIEASSVDYNQVSYDSGICIIPPQASPQYVDPKGTKILFFYSVEWKESNVSWANRWNIYLKKAITDTHWNILFLITATVIVLSLSVAILLSMALEKDIARYRGVDRDSLAILESAVEESGLNLIYADLFRPPTNNLLFAAVVGGGIQVFVITFIIVLLAMFGMFSSASRGAIGNCTIYSFGFSGLVAGYFSGRLYKTMEGKKWKKSAFLTATLYPGIVFGAYFFLNFFLWNKHSSGAVPFSTMISLLGIWFGISLPLVYLGYFFGYHKKPFTHPVRTNHETRKIPDELRVQNAMFSAILAIIPFSIILMDYEQIMTTLWKNDPYNIIVFPFTFFIYLIITCCITSIIRVYSQLEKRDYRWWWESFTLGGISAVYIQIYAIYYFSKKSNITGLFPTLIYFSYMGLIVITYWFFVGTISFFAAYIFIKKIYATIKLD